MRLIPGTQRKRLLKPSEMKKMNINKYVLDLAIDPNDLDDSEAIDVELNLEISRFITLLSFTDQIQINQTHGESDSHFGLFPLQHM